MITYELHKYNNLYKELMKHEIYGEDKYTLCCHYITSMLPFSMVIPYYIIRLMRKNREDILSYIVRGEGGYYYV